ncbi:hypothetical protein ACWCP6_07990 [Streptomyces sp. NPDC002004]
MTKRISTLALSSAAVLGALVGAAAPALADGGTGTGPVRTDLVSTAVRGGVHSVEDCGRSVAARPEKLLGNCSQGALAP